MTYLLSPSNPDDDANGDGASSESPRGQTGRRRSRRTPLPSVDEILASLCDLNGAMLLKIVSTQQAAVMQRGMKMILDVLMTRASKQTNEASLTDLAALARRDPAIVEMLESFLSDEQIEWLLRHGRGDND